MEVSAGLYFWVYNQEIYIVSTGYKTAVDGAVIRCEFSFLSPSGQSAIKLFDNCTPSPFPLPLPKNKGQAASLQPPPSAPWKPHFCTPSHHPNRPRCTSRGPCLPRDETNLSLTKPYAAMDFMQPYRSDATSPCAYVSSLLQ